MPRTEAQKEARRKYRSKEATKAKERTYARSYYWRNRDEIGRRVKFNTYGLTEETYDELVARADGHCEACGRPFGTAKLEKPNIDHCHASGDIRGLLCAGCNLTLGTAQDDVERLRQLASYIEDFYADR